jgi:hypothetical protein
MQCYHYYGEEECKTLGLSLSLSLVWWWFHSGKRLVCFLAVCRKEGSWSSHLFVGDFPWVYIHWTLVGTVSHIFSFWMAKKNIYASLIYALGKKFVGRTLCVCERKSKDVVIPFLFLKNISSIPSGGSYHQILKPEWYIKFLFVLPLHFFCTSKIVMVAPGSLGKYKVRYGTNHCIMGVCVCYALCKRWQEKKPKEKIIFSLTLYLCCLYTTTTMVHFTSHPLGDSLLTLLYISLGNPPWHNIDSSFWYWFCLVSEWDIPPGFNPKVNGDSFPGIPFSWPLGW